jgi:hypothetical protein
MNPLAQNRDSLPGKFNYSAFSKELDLLPARALNEVISLTAEQMARASRLVMGAYNELLQVAASLEDQTYRRLMTECIAAPKITFLDLYPTREDRQQLFEEMVGLGFFNSLDSVDEVLPANPESPQTYLTAPSSHNHFYNAHPGGLAVTVAYNVRMAEAYTANYRQMFGLPINRDLPSAALCIRTPLHLSFTPASGARRFWFKRKRSFSAPIQPAEELRVVSNWSDHLVRNSRARGL